MKSWKLFVIPPQAVPPVEFQFRASGSRFLVKNFTSGYITCGILDAER